jgi:nitroimidazol reductase NimA-like FMN-containing flavoprotein (pyridoxamine 5'-phosphate oxidase superfamily)
MVDVQYRAMTVGEVDLHLTRNQLARVVYSRQDQLDIELVSYVYEDGWMYGHTGDRHDIEMSESGWWPVSIGVEEVVEGWGWRSVVVHGGFHTLDPQGFPWEREAVTKALELLSARIAYWSPKELTVAILPGTLFRVRVENFSARTPVRPPDERAGAPATPSVNSLPAISSHR